MQVCQATGRPRSRAGSRCRPRSTSSSCEGEQACESIMQGAVSQSGYSLTTMRSWMHSSQLARAILAIQKCPAPARAATPLLLACAQAAPRTHAAPLFAQATRYDHATTLLLNFPHLRQPPHTAPVRHLMYPSMRSARSAASLAALTPLKNRKPGRQADTQTQWSSKNECGQRQRITEQAGGWCAGLRAARRAPSACAPAVGRPVMAKRPRMGAHSGLSGWMTPKRALRSKYSNTEPTCVVR